MHWIDIGIMVLYLVGCAAAGMLARGKGDDAEDYFTASGGMNTWFQTIVVGLSIAGTFFSGISFIAYPSVVYGNGIVLPFWGLLVSMPLCYVVLRFWFLPRFLAHGWRFPYEVLEAKFGAPTRTVAASLYVLMRVGWMAAMIYAPTVAIMTMGNLDPKWFWPIVLITGLTNTLYTVVAGVRGVIVTEAIQMLVMMLGIAATIAACWWQLPVPMSTAVSDLAHSGKLNPFNFTLDFTSGLTVWTVLIGVTTANLTNYIGDQMSLQRYLATGDTKAASRSFAVNIIGVVIVVSLLTTVGLSLYVFYSHTGGAPDKTDQIFPHFVATRLPVGVAGLLLAGLLAATSIPSGINTLAAVLTLDFHARLDPNMSERKQLWCGRIYSLVIGLAATGAAGIVSSLGSLFELSQIILGVFAGPLLSCVIVAVSGWRCSGPAMIAGMMLGWLAGCGMTWAGSAATWVAPTSALTTAVMSLLITRLAGFGRAAVPAPVTLIPDPKPPESGFEVVPPQ